MKAAVMLRPNEVQILEAPVPGLGPKDVLVQVKSVGVCGSDVHYYKTGGTGAFQVKAPIILGHEVAGEVVKVGPEVTRHKPGDRVAIEPGIPCFKCDLCLSGRYNLCPDVVFMATPPIDGAFAEYVKILEDFAFTLPQNVSFDEGAMLEPFAVGLYAAHRGQITTGASVAVLGCGPIGIMAIQAARVAGATQIIAVDIQEKRLEFAQKMGATAAVNSGQGDPCAAILSITNNRGADVAIEASGATPAIQLAVKSVRRGGKVVIVGVPSATEVSLPVIYLLENEIDILPIFRYVNMYPKAISLVSKGLIDLRSMITHRFELNETKAALDFAHEHKNETMKVVVNT